MPRLRARDSISGPANLTPLLCVFALFGLANSSLTFLPDVTANKLYVVCKDQKTNACETWLLDVEKSKYKSNEIKPYNRHGQICGLSDLKPIPPHQKLISVTPFDGYGQSKIFCKTLNVVKEDRLRSGAFIGRSTVSRQYRERRQAYGPRGRYRGQTQSQYLAIDGGSGKDEGKAEALSAADSSRASVSGNSGMGQAQSQTIYDPSCDECYGGRSDMEASNLRRPHPDMYGGHGSPGAGGGTGGQGMPDHGGIGGYRPGQTGNVGQGGNGGRGIPGQGGLGGHGIPGQGGNNGQRLPGQAGIGGQGEPGQGVIGGQGIPGQGGIYGQGLPGQGGVGGHRIPGQGSMIGQGIPGQGGINGQGIPEQRGFNGQGIPGQGGMGGQGMPGHGGTNGHGIPGQGGITLQGIPGQGGINGHGIPGQVGLGGQRIPGQGGISGQDIPGQGGLGIPVQGGINGQRIPGQGGMGGQGIPGQGAMGGQRIPGQSGISGQGIPGQGGINGQRIPGQGDMGGQGIPGQGGMGGLRIPGQSGISGQGIPGLGGMGGQGIPGQGGISGQGIPGQGGVGGQGIPGQGSVNSQGIIGQGGMGGQGIPGLGGQGIPGQGGNNGQGIPGQGGMGGQRIPGQGGMGGQGIPGQGGINGQGIPGQGGINGQGIPGQGGINGQGIPGQGGIIGQGIPGQGGINGQGIPGQGANGEIAIPGQVGQTKWPLATGPIRGADGLVYYCCVVNPNQEYYPNQMSANAGDKSQTSGSYGHTDGAPQFIGGLAQQPHYGNNGNGQPSYNYGSGQTNPDGTYGNGHTVNPSLGTGQQPNYGVGQPGQQAYNYGVGRNQPNQYGQTGDAPSTGNNVQLKPNGYGNIGNGQQGHPYTYNTGPNGQGIPGQGGINGQGIPGQGGLGGQGIPGQGGMNGQGIPGQGGINGQGIPGQGGMDGQGIPGQGGLGPNYTGHTYGPGGNAQTNSGGTSLGSQFPTGTGQTTLSGQGGQNVPDYSYGSGGNGLSNKPGTYGHTGRSETPYGSGSHQQTPTNGVQSTLYNQGGNAQQPSINSEGGNSHGPGYNYGTDGSSQPNLSGTYGQKTNSPTYGGSSTQPQYGAGGNGQQSPNYIYDGNGQPGQIYGQGSGPQGQGRNGQQSPGLMYGQGAQPTGGTGGQSIIGGTGSQPGVGTGTYGQPTTGVTYGQPGGGSQINYGQGANNNQGPDSNYGSIGTNPSANYGAQTPGIMGSQNSYQNSGYGQQGNDNINPVNGGSNQGQQNGYGQGTTQIAGNGGEPQNVMDPNNIIEDDDSQALASVYQGLNGTTAQASSQGGNEKGHAQTNVQGTYTDSGSFSAQASISDETKGAESQVSGSRKGATSNAEGRGRKNKSQAAVKLGSETGSIQTESQSGGNMHSSNTQVQGSVKGGVADAQARGPGSTSSQAQIGFTPYKEGDKSHDTMKTPFEGGGTASAQSSGRMGTSQSQLRGTFKYGITYNGAAQAGASLDKDAVFSNFTPFDKIDVFDQNSRNINVNVENTDKPLSIDLPPDASPSNEGLEKNEENIIQDSNMGHSHYDHHKPKEEVNTTNVLPLPSNRRAFSSTYDNNNNGGDYDYNVDDTPTDEYDVEEVPEGVDNIPNEYTSYDNYGRETENTHQPQRQLSTSRKGLEVRQSTGGNTQHIVLGSLKNQDAKITQIKSERPDESKVYQPGERVPGMGGYTIPAGFTGSVKSVSSKEQTYVVGTKHSPSQAQTVTLTPGSGKVKYTYPDYYGRNNIHPKDLRSLHNPRADDNRYVSVSKSVTRDLDSENNIRKQYSHTYYTKSSSCGYFTFTCTMVSSAEGKKKVCRPKIPTNPDGTPMRC